MEVVADRRAPVNAEETAEVALEDRLHGNPVRRLFSAQSGCRRAKRAQDEVATGALVVEVGRADEVALAGAVGTFRFALIRSSNRC